MLWWLAMHGHGVLLAMRARLAIHCHGVLPALWDHDVWDHDDIPLPVNIFEGRKMKPEKKFWGFIFLEGYPMWFESKYSSVSSVYPAIKIGMLKLELGVVKETMKAKAGVSYHINRLKMTLSNVGPELTCSLGTKGRPKPQETNVLHWQGKAVGIKISKCPSVQ